MSEELAASLSAALGAPPSTPASDPSPQPAAAQDDSAGNQPDLSGTNDAPAGATETAAPATTDYTGVREWVRDAFGEDLTGKYKSDEEFLRGALEAMRLVGRRNEYAQLGQAAISNPEKILEFYQKKHPELFSKYAAPPQQAEQAPEDFDPSWLSYIGRDQSGAVGIDPNAPAHIVRQINAWHEGRQERALQKKVDALVEKRLKEAKPPQDVATKQDVQRELAARQVQQESESYLYNNRQWLFNDGASDGSGLTPMGQVFHDTLARIHAEDQYGTIGMATRVQLAENAVRAAFPTKPQQAPPASAKNKSNTPAIAPQGKAQSQPGESLYDSLMRVSEDLDWDSV